MKTFKEFLEVQIIHTDKYTLTIFHVLVAILIVFATTAFLRAIKRIFARQVSAGRLELGKSHAIYQMIKYLVWVISVALTLDAVGIKITFLLASSAALLVGLGLGLQKLFMDFVSGITLLVEGTIKVGDVVENESGEVGIVREIGMRTSKLETRNNIILIVPNSTLINENVINWSHNENITRFSVDVGVAYGSDVRLVEKTLLECAQKNPKVLDTPTPTVLFTDFGESSLNFKLLFYTAEIFRVEYIKSQIRFDIDAAFRTNGITIPFPQRDVHIKK